MIIEHKLKSAVTELLSDISHKYEIVFKKNSFHSGDRPKPTWQHYEYAESWLDATRVMAELRTKDGHTGHAHTYMIKNLTKVKK